MKLITAAAIAFVLSSGLAFAQEANTDTGGNTTGADTDPSTYLAGPNLQRFYTDEARTTMIPEAEFKTNWQALSADDQAKAKQACMGNKDNRWSTFCNSIGNM